MKLNAVVVVLAIAGLTGCSAIKRDAACEAAQKCDEALEEPFGDYAPNDPVFGDDLNNDGKNGLVGDVGTCWQSADTAKPCIDDCKAFVKDQAELAAAAGNQAIVDACGGVADAGEGEGEGEGQ